jgi:PHD/YefM family antitoxin component YafN of YafNO toxin-antitoxin module
MTNLADLHPQYITNEQGEKTAIILPISEFQQLLEDLEDLSILTERQDEPTIVHENLIAELKQDGIL